VDASPKDTSPTTSSRRAGFVLGRVLPPGTGAPSITEVTNPPGTGEPDLD
jgi:hypothetical protein